MSDFAVETDGPLAHSSYVCKTLKPCEQMKPRTVLELDPPSPGGLPKG